MNENNDKAHLIEVAQAHFALAEPKIKSLVEEAGENERPFNSIYDSVNSRLIELSGMEGAEIPMSDSMIVLALVRGKAIKLLDYMRKEYPVQNEAEGHTEPIAIELTPIQERVFTGIQADQQASEYLDDPASIPEFE